MTLDEQFYAFGNAHDVQRERLGALEALLDAGTIQQLERCGVGRGWRCIEVGAGGGSIAAELDFVSLVPAPQLDADSRTLFTRVMHAHTAVLAERHGFDHAYGRRLVGDLTDAGLTDIGCEGRVSMWRGDGPGGTVLRLTLCQLREALIASGLVTGSEVDDAIALCRDPRLSFLS